MLLPFRRVLAAVLLLVLTTAACGESNEHFLSVPIPIRYEDGLLYVQGEALPQMDRRCRADAMPAPPSSSSRMLLDLGMPMTVMSDAAGRPPQPFLHGQVEIDATLPSLDRGPPRLLLCDIPLVRGNQALSEFRLDRKEPGADLAVTTGPLGAVLGGDLFGRFALSFRFAPSTSMGAPGAELTIERSDITPSCFLDAAVLPYQPLGGDLLVEVGDSLLSYLPNRITVAACVEPLADPLAYRPTGSSVTACIDEAALDGALADQNVCDNPAALGDLVDRHPEIRRDAYKPSGVNMRFLLSTAVPDLLLSETSCQRLAGGDTRCRCNEEEKITLRLPGLNGPQPDGSFSEERGCHLRLGGAGRAALSLIAKGLHLSPCAELARSRRQRYALPAVLPPSGVVPPKSDCHREACLENLNRTGSLTGARCAYQGMFLAEACDDHRASVMPYVELGGPPDDPLLPDDTIDVLVVPDAARVLQSANADLRNLTAQVDGVLGVSLLQRLHTVVDYPQNRLVLSCRCADNASKVCRTYRGISYHDADVCVPDSTLRIPADFARTTCR